MKRGQQERRSGKCEVGVGKCGVRVVSGRGEASLPLINATSIDLCIMNGLSFHESRVVSWVRSGA